jgi:ribosome-associated protein YbcJ (S4-like RNA binding protein)
VCMVEGSEAKKMALENKVKAEVEVENRVWS